MATVGSALPIELNVSQPDHNVSYSVLFNNEPTGGYTDNDTTNLWLASATNVSGNGTLSGSGTYYPIIRQPVHMIVIYSLAYSIVFLVGLVGNALVVVVVYRNIRMHNVTNYFIVNLAIADVLVCLLCLPMTLLTNLYSGWRFGAVMCKATPFLQGVAVSASVSTLTAIAIDRYLAICHTLEFRMTRKMARISILLIWTMAMAIMSPWAVFYEQTEFSTPLQKMYLCEQNWPSKNQERGYFLGAIFLTCYTIPLIFISVCYTFIGLRVWYRDAPGIANTSQAIYKSKVKVLKMLVCVVILFAISWLPLYAVHVRIYFGKPLNDNGSSTEFKWLSQIILPVAQWLGSSNSCVNPIIYCFFSKKFRRGFTEFVLCCKHGSQSNPYFLRNSSTVYRSVTDNHNHTLYTSIRNPDRRDGYTPRSVLTDNKTTCF